MFTRLQSGVSGNQRKVVASSLAVHAMIFAWLLHAPEPRLLLPTAVARGHNGKVVTQLYWTSRLPDDSDSSSSDSASEVYRRQRLAHDKLIWNRKPTLAMLPPSLVHGLRHAQLWLSASVFQEYLETAIPATVSPVAGFESNEQIKRP